jgi:hypothetical protein
MTPEDNAILIEIGRGEEQKAVAKKTITKFILARFSIRLVIATAGVACIVITYRVPAGSYVASLLPNLATGLLVFLAVVPTLRSAHMYPRQTACAGALVAVALLIASYVTAGVTQGLLINGAVGVLLLLALDLTINRWLDTCSVAEMEARAMRKRAIELIRAGTSELDFKYALFDYLNLPRPDQFGGIALPEGVSLADEVMKAAGEPPSIKP